jgi:hypothetical protein
MNNEWTFQHLQQPATGPIQRERTVESKIHTAFRARIFMLSTHIRVDLPDDRFFSGFPTTNLYILLVLRTPK